MPKLYNAVASALSTSWTFHIHLMHTGSSLKTQNTMSRLNRVLPPCVASPPRHFSTSPANCEPPSTYIRMSQVISLFNIENESLGVVRNLVGVGIGTNLRAGIHPAASDALAFLIRVNDRAVGLIEDLDLLEKQRRQQEAERLLAQGPGAHSPASDKGKGGKRSVFARLASLSPGSRSRRSPTPPLTPPESPAHQSVAYSVASDNNSGEGGGLQRHLEKGRGGAEVSRTGKGMSRQQRSWGTSVLGFDSPRGRRGGPLPPPVVHDASQQSPSRRFLGSAPVLLHSYAKLLNSLVCGSYNLRAAYFSSCEADLRNIGREGGYLVRVVGGHFDFGVHAGLGRQVHTVNSCFARCRSRVHASCDRAFVSGSSLTDESSPFLLPWRPPFRTCWRGLTVGDPG